MITKNQKIWISMGIIALLVISVLIFAVRTSSVGEETVDIGAIFMLTGTGANWGLNSQRGADLAVAEINAAGGIQGKPLQIIYEDNQGDNAKIAVSALKKLQDQDVNIILGPNWSPSGQAIAPIACEQGSFMISPSLGVADFNEACDSLFNLWPHDDLLSEKLGQYLYDQGYRSIAVLGSLQAWEQTQAYAVKRGFESKGGEVVSFQLVQPEEKTFGSEVVKIKSSNPQAVVFTNYAFEHLSAKRLREINVAVPFFSILMDDERIQGAQGAFEGTVIITSFTPSKTFAQKFVATYGEQPDIGSDTSYDAVKLIAQAMEKTTATDPTVLKNYVNALDSYNGVSGNLVFDGKGGVIKEPQFKIVQNGKLVPLE